MYVTDVTWISYSVRIMVFSECGLVVICPDYSKENTRSRKASERDFIVVSIIEV